MSQTDQLPKNNEAYACTFAFTAAIERETVIRPAWAAEAFPDLEADVRQPIARIEASPFIPRKESVRGFVSAVETGRRREVV